MGSEMCIRDRIYVSSLMEELDQNHSGFEFKSEDGKLTKEAFMFARFLVEDLNGMSFESYLDAVETNVDRDVIHLKRKPWESRINNYNPHLLAAWRANCDLQYILDPFAAIVYITNYVTKGDKGTAVAVQHLTKEMKHLDLTVKERTRKYGNTILKSQEVSAEEATWYLMMFPFTGMSRQVMWLDTNSPEKRFRMTMPVL